MSKGDYSQDVQVTKGSGYSYSGQGQVLYDSNGNVLWYGSVSLYPSNFFSGNQEGYYTWLMLISPELGYFLPSRYSDSTPSPGCLMGYYQYNNGPAGDLGYEVQVSDNFADSYRFTDNGPGGTGIITRTSRCTWEGVITYTNSNPPIYQHVKIAYSGYGIPTPWYATFTDDGATDETLFKEKPWSSPVGHYTSGGGVPGYSSGSSTNYTVSEI